MGLFDSLGGMASGFEGALSGIREINADNQAKEDRAYQREQRDYQREQWKRTRADQKIEDELKAADRNVPTTQEVEVNPDRATTMPMVDDEGTPSAAQIPATKTLQRSNADMMRDYAANRIKAGKMDDALKYTQAADKLDWDAANRKVNDLELSIGKGMPLIDAVNAGAAIFNGDSFPGSVKNVRPGTDQDGKPVVAFDIYNKSTGQTQTKQVSNAQQLTDMLRAHYSPDTYEQLRAARQKSILETNAKIAEKRAAGINVTPGSKHLEYNETTGKWEDVADNTNGFTTLKDKDGNDILDAEGKPQLIKSNLRINQGSGNGADKPFKMDEDQKLQFTESAKSVHAAERDVIDVMKEFQKTNPGGDPDKDPTVAYAKKNLQAAKINHYKTQIQVGMITPDSVATQIFTVAKTPQDIIKSINEIGQTAGTQFADKVTSIISDSDAWKSMNAGKNPSWYQGGSTDQTQPQQQPQPNSQPKPKMTDAELAATKKPASASWQMTHGEQQFANSVAKFGWEPYVKEYGSTGEPAYKKPDGKGGWVVKAARDLAKEIGVLY